jgi:hypothetical protein
MSANIIDSIAGALQKFLDHFFCAKSGVVSAQGNARLGGGNCHKCITAILSESAVEFQFQR